MLILRLKEKYLSTIFVNLHIKRTKDGYLVHNGTAIKCHIKKLNLVRQEVLEMSMVLEFYSYMIIKICILQ